MTDREHRLRARIDRLTDHRDALILEKRELANTKKTLQARVKSLENGSALLRCVYCGAPCRGHVCRAHSDLLGAA